MTPSRQLALKTKYFQYRQNNSGGVWQIDHAGGISQNVIIEAVDAEDADHKAQQIGIYFNGCDNGMDCPCCGDRWSEANWSWSSEKGDEVPMIYGTEVGKNKPMVYEWEPLFEDDIIAYIHHIDGTVDPVEFVVVEDK